jgi:hypothetical protein
MSNDAEREYFVDGIVADIITGLSRIKWLFVVARNSTFVYKGRAVSLVHLRRPPGVSEGRGLAARHNDGLAPTPDLPALAQRSGSDRGAERDRRVLPHP